MPKISLTMTVADGGTLSSFASFRGASPKAVFVPVGAEGSWLAFQRGEGANVGYCRGWDGAKLTAAFVPGSWVELDARDLAGVDALAIELCNDEAGTAQPQTGAVTLTVIGT